ncbi:hypothetical protein QBC47DRAFT_321298 [Echria macrotheca]|uniref:Cytochrome b561 domain-containing protein n=1 Tax=Echria macrotheca TaxID=438768 RepID=A0AAJ0FCI0_9PEZI|nr:hypothetical protein QBC47DRAFT_321298 [Echria macrotheca]
MAPADTLSPPGSSSYDSNTMTVGDGTWDFTKNTFLLPNLVGLNFETMQYNGMANRFATLTQYHSLILGHGVLAAITFLFIIPIAVLLVRFYGRHPGTAIRYHAYLQILAVGFTTIIFILGFIAVGPPRNLTNPHHGIGVAIYVLILLQAVGGRIVRNITGRSFRLHMHRWSGRAVALLGIVQVPLGLTLYGSPKYTFILYAVWMAFLLLLYFILDYRHQGYHGDYGGGSSYVTTETPRKEKKSGMKWLGPLAAGAAGLALLRGRKKDRDIERRGSRSPSLDRSHRGPEVLPSPRQSDSYFDEKSSRREKKGGFMSKLMMAGAGVGAGAMVGRMLGRRGKDRDDEYSAVATDTPSRLRKPRRGGPADSEFTDLSEEYSRAGRHDRRSPLLPPPGDPVVAAAAISAAERPLARPSTPRHSHHGRSRVDTIEDSEYSSYVSPSRRASAKKDSGGRFGKAGGLLAGLGLGFLAKKGLDRRHDREEDRRREEEDRRRDEEDRRSGRRNPRYTGDGYGSPSRRDSRRRPTRPRPAASAVTATTVTESSIEPRGDTPYDPVPPGAPRPPANMPIPPGAGLPPSPMPGPGAVPIPPSGVGRSSRSQSRSRYEVGEGLAMPQMPHDPQGILHPESGSEAYLSSGGGRHQRHRVRRDADAAAAVAAASAGLLAAEEEDRRRRDRRGDGTPPTHPAASVRVKVDTDRDRNITLRRVTDDEAAAAARRDRRRRDSVSSASEIDTPTGRRYRRDGDSGTRRAEQMAEQHVENDPLLPPLSPPNPAFAQGRRPQGKDSAYYSGGGAQPGPSGSMPQAGATVSSLGGLQSPGGSRGDFGAISPASSGLPGRDSSANAAADRRRRRRIERREGSASRPPGTVDFE